MKKYYAIIAIIIIAVFSSCSDNSTSPDISGYVDKVEGQKAFEYLNKIRQNPSAYSSEIGVDLSYVNPIHKLVWNDLCARVAEAKAMDMVRRDYFEHVDPDGYGINYYLNKIGYSLPEYLLSDKKQNNFESIAALYGQEKFTREYGVPGIKQLIYDRGWDPPGHRIHLLGLDKFWEDCVDCGIGVAYSDDKTIVKMCVVIAHHGKMGGTINIIL